MEILAFCFVCNGCILHRFETEIELEIPGIYNWAVANSFTNDSILYRYPWWISCGLRDAANIEWIPAQEFRYRAIEHVLYNFVGGSYEPGSIGRPYKPDFKYSIIIAQSEDAEDKDCLDVTRQPKEISQSSDIVTGRRFPWDKLQNTSIRINNQNVEIVDTNAVPEPSSITLFCFTAFGYLLMKNKAV